MRRALLTCLTTLFATSAFPCSCDPERTIQSQLADAEVVFRGTTLSRDDYVNETPSFPLEGGYVVRFRVLEVWKGNPAQEFVVVSGPGNCRVPHETGQAYLVFAARWPKAGKHFWTNRCAGTREASAPEAEALLGPSRASDTKRGR